MSHLNSDIINWVKKAIATEDCLVEINGKVGKGNGFIGDIICVKVTFNNNEKEKELHLIAKLSKISTGKERFMADFCRREVAFYKEIIPIFKQFQEEKNIAESFNSVPKCYKAFLTEHTEVIVQEDLRTRGFELHESSVAMNMNHMKLVLKNYAKFHALSFALRDQRPEIFKKIEEICYNHIANKISTFEPMYVKGTARVIQNLHEVGRKDLAEKYEKLVKEGSVKKVTEIFSEVHKYRVLAHADCHNGNFLFQYKDDNKENPSNVVFLDFQISCMLSPVIDLGSYIYCGASKEELSHFSELMKFYHNELSSFLSLLGSDVNKFYPISALWEDWRKYSFHGFNTATLIMELLFVDKEDAPEGVTDPNEDFLDLELKNRSPYLERLTGIVEHYLDFQNL